MQKIKKQKLALGSICLLAVSTALIFGARILVSHLGLMAVMSFSWTPAALSFFTVSICIVGYVLSGLGVGAFLYLGLQSRFTVDTQEVKTQSKKLRFAVVGVVSLLVVISCFASVPLIKADAQATTGFYLSTPLPIS